MANAVYYGKSTTAGNEAIKKVYLTDSSVTADTLQEGDLLVVYFAYGLEVDSPSLALYIGDVNEEISVSEDSGKAIYNTGSIHAQAGDWTNGEVVTFSYTTNTKITENADNTFYWEMVATVRATEENYGRVILDRDDAAAATVGKVKQLINRASSGSLSYSDKYLEGIEIGTLTLTNIDVDGVEKEDEAQTVTIHIPKNEITVPTSLADFATDSQLPFNNATQLGYTINSEQEPSFYTVLDLDSNNKHDVQIYSPANLYLNADESGKVIIGFNSSDINQDLQVNGTISAKQNANITKKLTAGEISTGTISVSGPISAANATTSLGDTTVKSINVTGNTTLNNATVNGTVTFGQNGAIKGGPAATLGATSVTSLNIGSKSLKTYINDIVGNVDTDDTFVRYYTTSKFYTLPAGRATPTNPNSTDNGSHLTMNVYDPASDSDHPERKNYTYTPLAIVGYNLTQQDTSSGSSDSSPDINLWELYYDGTNKKICFAFKNLNTKTNHVKVAVQMLYQRKAK